MSTPALIIDGKVIFSGKTAAAAEIQSCCNPCRSCHSKTRVTGIQGILPASQSNISQHLTVLRNARLVDFGQDGAQRCYYVSRPRLASEVIALLAEDEPAIRKTRDEINLNKQSAGGACCVQK